MKRCLYNVIRFKTILFIIFNVITAHPPVPPGRLCLPPTGEGVHISYRKYVFRSFFAGG